MRIRRLLVFCIGIGIFGSEHVISQIPAKGSDFTTLSNLRWDMSIQNVRELISSKREIQKSTSTTLSYDDTLLNSKAIITLKFDEENICLKSIDATFSQPNKELSNSLYTYLVTKYGDKFISNKEQKTKLFMTFVIEMKIWKLDDEGVGMGVFSRGDETIGVNIFYSHSKTK